MSAVQSVERAFSIIGCLASGTSGVSDIADRADLPKSTVSRLLETLVDLGVVEQTSPGGGYRLGRYLHELATAALPNRTLIESARPHLTGLVSATGEASGLSILDGTDVLYLDQAHSQADIQVRNWTGERIRPHLVSSGLVLLAFGDPEAIASALTGPLQAATARSTTDLSMLHERLDSAREAGYAWAIDELSEGLSSVAAPVRNHAGVAIAALHVHGPTFRFPGSQPDVVAARVVAAANRLAETLR
jgi:DNA-binding IclR family transcriptional regulator